MAVFDMVGRMVSKVTRMRLPEFDDEAWLRVDFEDGEHCFIVASDDNYTGKSRNEYQQIVAIISESREGLVPIDDLAPKAESGHWCRHCRKSVNPHE